MRESLESQVFERISVLSSKSLTMFPMQSNLNIFPSRLLTAKTRTKKASRLFSGTSCAAAKTRPPQRASSRSTLRSSSRGKIRPAALADRALVETRTPRPPTTVAETMTTLSRASRLQRRPHLPWTHELNAWSFRPDPHRLQPATVGRVRQAGVLLLTRALLFLKMARLLRNLLWILLHRPLSLQALTTTPLPLLAPP